VVIDEPAARQLFSDADPVGQAIQFAKDDTAEKSRHTIVGVVSGVRHDLIDRKPVPHVYQPIGQNYRGNVYLHVRVAGPAMGQAACRIAAEAIRAATRSAFQLRTLQQRPVTSCSGEHGCPAFGVWRGAAACDHRGLRVRSWRSRGGRRDCIRRRRSLSMLRLVLREGSRRRSPASAWFCRVAVARL
jgi:hypothetical protein